MPTLVEYLLQQEDTTRKALLQCLGTEVRVSVDARDRVTDFLTERGYAKQAARMPLLGMTRDDALQLCMRLFAANDSYAASTLMTLRTLASVPDWTPTLEATLQTFKSMRDVKSDEEWNQIVQHHTSATKLTSGDLLSLLCDPQWRLATAFLSPAKRLRGQPFALREVRLWKSPINISTRFKEAIKCAPSDILIHYDDDTWSIVDWTLTEAPTAIAAPPAHTILCSIPSRSTIAFLTEDKQLKFADYCKNEWTVSSVAYSIPLASVDFLDCVVTPKGTLVVQLGMRGTDSNVMTGGLTDFITYCFSSMFLHVDLTDEEEADALKLDEQRLRQAKSLDFRDHGSVISLKIDVDGSTACYQDLPLLQSSEVLVSALGAPQDFVTVGACGFMARMQQGEESQTLELDKPVRNAFLFTRPFETD